MDGGPALARALAFALEAHGEQVRKGTDVPYVSHLLAVAAYESRFDAVDRPRIVVETAIAAAGSLSPRRLDELAVSSR